MPEKQIRAQKLVKISRAVYVPAAALGMNAPPWVSRRLVAEARILSLPHRLKNPHDFALSGESALVALGLDT